MGTHCSSGNYNNPALNEPLHVAYGRIDTEQHVTKTANILDSGTGLRRKRALHEKENSTSCFVEINANQDLYRLENIKAKRARDNEKNNLLARLSSGEPAELHPADSAICRKTHTLSSNDRDNDKKNRRVSSIISQAETVGQAVEEMLKSNVDCASSACFRSRPQRRNSFVIHKNHLGVSGIPVVQSSRSVSASIVVDTLCTSLALLEETMKVIEASSGDQKSPPPSLKKQEAAIAEDEMQPSLLSMLTDSYNRSMNKPVLTEEEKEYYGYE